MNINDQDCRELLHTGLEALGLRLEDAVIDKLLAYQDMLRCWNRVYNLTAITDPQQMTIQHLLDSLTVLPSINDSVLLDVGTGAGLPGMVLAMARPELHCHLLDSNSKKTRFLTQVVIECAVPNVTVHHVRAEQFSPALPMPLIISRAYSSLQAMIESIGHCLSGDGKLLAMKGLYPSEELDALPAGWQAEVVRLQVPMLEAERHLVTISRTSPSA